MCAVSTRSDVFVSLKGEPGVDVVVWLRCNDGFDDCRPFSTPLRRVSSFQVSSLSSSDSAGVRGMDDGGRERLAVMDGKC